MDAIDQYIAQVAGMDLRDDLVVGPDEFRQLLAATGLQFNECCNRVALRVARRFDRGDLSFEDGDAVMNVVFSRMTDIGTNSALPEPAFAIYEAFDLGEFDHPRDSPGLDPVALYTVPAIAEILRVAGA